MILEKIVEKKDWYDFSLYLINLGQSYCLSNKPKCSICPLNKTCIYSLGMYLNNNKNNKNDSIVDVENQNKIDEDLLTSSDNLKSKDYKITDIEDFSSFD